MVVNRIIGKAYFTILLFLSTTVVSEVVELEPILRGSEEISYHFPCLIPEALPSYPWETKGVPTLLPITPHHFQCRGSRNHPPRTMASGELQYDCDGLIDHGLPVRDGKEGVQPILVELLNYLQSELKAPVRITSGHRCPKHQSYMDPSPKAQGTKHLIGAEVAFYIEGFEEKIFDLIPPIEAFYKNHPRYKDRTAFQTFKRWDKETDVRTTPWYNEEIFIKLYQADEGRNLDNTHPYPYLSIQVRLDFEKSEKVQYTWKGGEHYFR